MVSCMCCQSFIKNKTVFESRYYDSDADKILIAQNCVV